MFSITETKTVSSATTKAVVAAVATTVVAVMWLLLTITAAAATSIGPTTFTLATTTSTTTTATITTVVIGGILFGLYYYYNSSSSRRKNGATITTTTVLTHQSRLLRNQFGSLIVEVEEQELQHDLHLVVTHKEQQHEQENEEEHEKTTMALVQQSDDDEILGEYEDKGNDDIHSHRRSDGLHIANEEETKEEDSIDITNTGGDVIRTTVITTNITNNNIHNDNDDDDPKNENNISNDTIKSHENAIDSQHQNEETDGIDNNNDDNNKNNGDVRNRQDDDAHQQHQHQKLHTRQSIQEYKRNKVLQAVETRLRPVDRLNHHHQQQHLATFCNWYDEQTLYFRKYILYKNLQQLYSKEEEDILYSNHDDFNPNNESNRSWNSRQYLKSHHHQQPIQLHVTNDLPHDTIYVYWYDSRVRNTKRDRWNNVAPYLIFKGTIASHGGMWYQTTYTHHHWIFKVKPPSTCLPTSPTINVGVTVNNGNDDNDSEPTDDVPILQFIPYNIPRSIMTADLDYDTVGTTTMNDTYRFHIVPSSTSSAAPTSNTATDIDASADTYYCSIKDPILPYPAYKSITTIRKAGEYAIQYCLQMEYTYWNILQKYISNIITSSHQQEEKEQHQYRRIRIGNQTFFNCVWNTPAKGILLAYGFVEIESEGYVYLFGDSDDTANDIHSIIEPLSKDMVYELELLYHMIQLAERKSKP